MKSLRAVVRLMLGAFVATSVLAEPSDSPATTFKWNVFLGPWQLAGPFPATSAVAGEVEAALCGQGHWDESLSRVRHLDSGVLNLNAALGTDTNLNVFAYAWTKFSCAEEQDAILAIGVDDGVTAWLNGQKVLERPGLRPCYLDEFPVRVRLAAGQNLLVLKVQNGPADWGVIARLLPADVGRPLLTFQWGKMPPLGAFEIYPTPDLKVEFLDDQEKATATHFVSGFRMFEQRPPWYPLYAAMPAEPPAKVRVSFRQSGFAPFEKTVDWEEAIRAPVIIESKSTLKISGRVVDAETGEPLAEVIIANPQGPFGGASDAAGEFSFGNIDPRLNTIMASKAGYSTSTAIVRAPFTRQVDFALSRGGRIVEGVVVDETNAPIPGVHVSLLNAMNSDPKCDTDAGGKFKIIGVPADARSIRIFLNHPDFVPVVQSLPDADKPTTPPGGYRLQRGGVVTGKISTAEDHQPLGGIRVVSWGPKNDTYVDAFTDLEGNYRLAGVVPGQTAICVESDEFAPAVRKVSVEAGAETETNFDLQPGATVTGRVFDEHGEPVAGAHLETHPWDGVLMMLRETQADANGEFTLPHMPGKPTSLRASKPGHPSTSNAIVEGGHDYQITLEPER